jgi:hypothetical protein
MISRPTPGARAGGRDRPVPATEYQRCQQAGPAGGDGRLGVSPGASFPGPMQFQPRQGGQERWVAPTTRVSLLPHQRALQGPWRGTVPP